MDTGDEQKGPLRRTGAGEAYTVMVTDNFHMPDDDAVGEAGKYAGIAEAVAACRKIVDGFLNDAYKPGALSEELEENFCAFGETPWVTPDAGGYDAREHVRQRCRELCREDDEAKDRLRVTQRPAELDAMVPVIEAALRRGAFDAKQRHALEHLQEQLGRIPKALPDSVFVLCLPQAKDIVIGERRHHVAVTFAPDGFSFWWHSEVFGVCRKPDHASWRPHACDGKDHVFWRVYFCRTDRLDRRFGAVPELAAYMKERLADESAAWVVHESKRPRGLSWQQEPAPGSF